jgi:hypothetical protein
MDLKELAEKEERLMEIVFGLSGMSMEDKHSHLEDKGIFDEYRNIHEAYAELYFETGDMEALKRAMFIQWYSISEPDCFTGIFILTKKSEEKVIREIEEMIAENRLDEEFELMLKWYYAVSDYYFEDLVPGPTIVKHFSNVDPGKKPFPDLERVLVNREGRGQMGYYFKSVIESHI